MVFFTMNEYFYVISFHNQNKLIAIIVNDWVVKHSNRKFILANDSTKIVCVDQSDMNKNQRLINNGDLILGLINTHIILIWLVFLEFNV